MYWQSAIRPYRYFIGDFASSLGARLAVDAAALSDFTCSAQIYPASTIPTLRTL